MRFGLGSLYQKGLVLNIEGTGARVLSQVVWYNEI
jgi:hypothetical protein